MFEQPTICIEGASILSGHTDIATGEEAMLILIEQTQEVMSFCDVAQPIYVYIQDYLYLSATEHGRQLLEWIKEHNQNILNICGEVPRTIIK